ncbi:MULTISPECIES: response regulator transcription factor [Lysinibacillus]|uniref:response regulator transcription factor n=1 Tax=Lysinibacillus TaxID=400634 RepID=UPI0001DA5B56|nr:MULTISPECIES: response regulator transcription factor [Lysinibacillus]EFI66965.1 competence protein A [Lysinibacillus fusiformis ZC1]EKU44197.1 competence protein A [Lysinibacillus fusiformis ZB2]MBU5254578.1 response regulator transcription factor [Lysinibacillus capsici]MBX8945191.1 response regulator transcription factor [Lysinibacillus sp. K60]MED4701194.1 response regulator transcription factor [Lysinibacillus capsici]
MIHILLVDDHQMVGLGTKAILENEQDFKVTYLHELEEIYKEFEISDYDIYLFDIQMPECSGIDLTKKLLAIRPKAKVILYTGFDYYSQFSSLMNLNICGIVSKTVPYEDLIMTIRATLKGYVLLPLPLLKELKEPIPSSNNLSTLLTQKEISILRSLIKGYSNQEIADELFLSIRAIEYNLTKIYKKLGVNSRTEAVTEVIRLDILKSGLP